MKYFIGPILKKARKNKELSVEDVANHLDTMEYPVSAKTIYGWEEDFAYPSVPVFLLLCELYDIEDILGTFVNEK